MGNRRTRYPGGSFAPRHRLFAPDLLIAECANVLWKKSLRGELNSQEACLAAGLLQRADIELAPMRSLLEPAARLAITLDHPAYDCIYLALAESMACSLVTADRRLSAKVLSPGLEPNVLVLTTSVLP